ncbi:acyl-CoA dehydrogenase family protein [Telluribacter sp. SYSU D00476]|uniref:acyl-CoA dehydrogenase family protein n=1 Tax=Telluribacter sp. SYSU D00476 TaxID=2811430 RepID=UPI001FF34E2A|nr:acyl-CoA dehydrogenase family protein [Telluribacter sp. SYSU D00476]
MDIDALIQKASDIVRSIGAQEAPVADRDGIWVEKTLRALQSEKLTGLVVPTECGGHGQGLYALVRICEELGKTYSSFGLCYGMHCVGTAVIAAKATEWQKKNYLEPIAAGEHITTLAVSEPGTGSHFYFPQTTLIALDEDDFLINGGKTFVTNGGKADSYVLSTVGASDEARMDQFSCIVLDEDTMGMQWGKGWDGLGMRGNSSISLQLNNIRIAGRHILGEKGDQLWYIFNVVAPYFLMSMAGTYLGIADAALEEAQRTLSSRTYSHNGTNLAEVSILQHRLGTIWARVESTRRLIYNAAMDGDKGDPGALPQILAAKAEVARCVIDVVNEAMTLAGGRGYESNSRLGLLMRDARAAHVMSPTTDLLYTWIGRALLDQPILSD